MTSPQAFIIPEERRQVTAGFAEVTLNGMGVGQSRLKHPWLRALGRDEMPASITLRDVEYTHLRTYKHDFFAATGLYEGPDGRVILKLGRTAGFFGLPLSWIGKMLAAHELDLYNAVHDLPGVPECLGPWRETGLVHVFVEGHPLQRKEAVGDEFFPKLRQLIQQLHERRIAYVDLEKRENILVDDKGDPSLIDFQISFRWPQRHERRGWKRLVPSPLGGYVLRKLQNGDLYHLRKHERRHRRDLLTPAEIEASYRAGPLIRLHRLITRPLTLTRRGILKLLTGNARSDKQDGAAFMEPVPREGGKQDAVQS